MRLYLKYLVTALIPFVVTAILIFLTKQENIPKEKKTNTKRVLYYDIAKGIGVLMVVWAHAKGPYNGDIAEFALPYFCIISGLLYSQRANLKDYIFGKAKIFYIPYVFWNLIAINFKRLNTRSHFDVTIEKNIRVLLMVERDGEYFGATWYLVAIFMICVLYKIFDVLIKHKYKDSIILGIFTIILIIGFLYKFPYNLSRVAILSFFYAFGVWFKNHKDLFRKYDHFIVALIFAIIYIIILKNNHSNMSENQYTNPFTFTIGAMMGTYSVLYITRLMEKYAGKFINNIFVILGKYSKDILIWQFVMFKIVIILQMYVRNDPITYRNVMDHYPIYDFRNGWWALYTLVGLIFPIILCYFMRKSKFIRKTCVF